MCGVHAFSMRSDMTCSQSVPHHALCYPPLTVRLPVSLKPYVQEIECLAAHARQRGVHVLLQRRHRPQRSKHAPDELFLCRDHARRQPEQRAVDCDVVRSVVRRKVPCNVADHLHLCEADAHCVCAAAAAAFCAAAAAFCAAAACLARRGGRHGQAVPCERFGERLRVVKGIKGHSRAVRGGAVCGCHLRSIRNKLWQHWGAAKLLGDNEAIHERQPLVGKPVAHFKRQRAWCACMRCAAPNPAASAAAAPAAAADPVPADRRRCRSHHRCWHPGSPRLRWRRRANAAQTGHGRCCCSRAKRAGAARQQIAISHSYVAFSGSKLHSGQAGAPTQAYVEQRDRQGSRRAKQRPLRRAGAEPAMQAGRTPRLHRTKRLSMPHAAAEGQSPEPVAVWTAMHGRAFDIGDQNDGITWNFAFLLWSRHVATGRHLRGMRVAGRLPVERLVIAWQALVLCLCFAGSSSSVVMGTGGTCQRLRAYIQRCRSTSCALRLVPVKRPVLGGAPRRQQQPCTYQQDAAQLLNRACHMLSCCRARQGSTRPPPPRQQHAHPPPLPPPPPRHCPPWTPAARPAPRASARGSCFRASP